MSPIAIRHNPRAKVRGIDTRGDMRDEGGMSVVRPEMVIIMSMVLAGIRGDGGKHEGG